MFDYKHNCKGTDSIAEAMSSGAVFVFRSILGVKILIKTQKLRRKEQFLIISLFNNLKQNKWKKKTELSS